MRDRRHSCRGALRRAGDDQYRRSAGGHRIGRVVAAGEVQQLMAGAVEAAIGSAVGVERGNGEVPGPIRIGTAGDIDRAVGRYDQRAGNVSGERAG